jgi:hypothetical protein
MQHIDNFDTAKPFSEIAKLAARESVSVEDLVVMSRKEYERISRRNLKRFEKAWRALGEEAQRNGLTPEKLQEILADER